jgi:hypothetical protein
VPTSNSPIPVDGVGTDGQYYSGNIFQYQLVDGTGAAMNQAGIPITEIVEGVDQNGNQTYYPSTQNTGSVPGTGPGQIDDFFGTETPGFLPNFTSFSSLTTTQIWFAASQGQNIGLTPVDNQQMVTIGGVTESCVTPIGQ